MKKLYSFVMIIALLFPGCLSIGSSGSIENEESFFNDDQWFSFTSAPNESHIVGYLELGPKEAPLESIDILYSTSFNESLTYCGYSSQYSDCVIVPDVPRGSHTTFAGEMRIEDNNVPICFDECQLKVEVYYFGSLKAVFYGINF